MKINYSRRFYNFKRNGAILVCRKKLADINESEPLLTRQPTSVPEKWKRISPHFSINNMSNAAS
jgi:hypothetical protein